MKTLKGLSGKSSPFSSLGQLGMKSAGVKQECGWLVFQFSACPLSTRWPVSDVWEKTEIDKSLA